MHLLDALRQRFCSNLEVTDEGDYFETRDINTLCQKTQLLDNAIGGLAEGLREHGLSREAAEDPSILAARIERVAALVQQKMADEPCDPSEPASGIDNDSDHGWREESLEEEVEVMDRLRRKNDLRMERMNRRIVEAVASGMSTQLKRALTGHAYARGAVFGLRSEGTISDEQSTALHDQLGRLSHRRRRTL